MDEGGQATTVALVHGAFTDSSVWRRLAAGLQARGFPVLAITNPLRSLAGDAGYVRGILATVDGPVALVGHGYGGAVIGEAARHAPNVRALVFIAAYVLDQGESVSTVLDPVTFPGSLLSAQTTLVRPGSDPDDQEIWIRTQDFARVLAADADPGEAQLMALAQRPLAVAAYRGVAGAPAWHSVASWALVAEQDRAVPAAGQRWMAGRAGARISGVAAGHTVMVTRPAAVAEVVVEAATTVG
jgi:pimeloyl-ACP methyl ester carboxylesterase